MKTYELQPGEVFEGKYRIAGLLGEGGFAAVYLAEHLELGHQVAIKLLQRVEAEVRFVREGQILAALTSPHTVRVLDFGRTADGTAYLVSEYVEGVGLDSVIARGPQLWADVASMVRQVLMSLAEAHEMGVVHRDLKPANIMQMRDGTVRTLDFGVAKIKMEDLTVSGAVMGTVRYMAPENLTGSKHVTAAMDVFAVGLLAQALLVGERPFEGWATANIVKELMAPTSFVLPGELDLPADARRFIERLLSKDPDRRPPNAGAALVELDEILGAQADLAAPVAKTPSPIPVLIGVFVVVLLAGFAWLKLRPDAPPPATALKPAQVVAPQLTPEFESAVAAFEYGDWLSALEQFDALELNEDEKSRLADKDYIRRAIDEVLVQETSEAARRDVQAVLKLHPEHPGASRRLVEIDAELAKRKRDKKRRDYMERNTPKNSPKNSSRGPAPVRSFDDLLNR